MAIPGQGSFLDTDRITSALGLMPGMHTADLGCGSGYFTISFARAVGSSGVVYAVDVRQEPLESLRAKAEAAGLANIREVRADLEVLGGTGIPDGSLDVSLLANTLFQSSKREEMVKEAARMLKSGGRLVIIEWRQGAGVPGGPPDDLRVSEDQAKRLAELAGTRSSSAIDAGTYCSGLIFIKP